MATTLILLQLPNHALLISRKKMKLRSRWFLFFKELAAILEANYFDKMLHHTSVTNQTEENDNPF